MNDDLLFSTFRRVKTPTPDSDKRGDTIEQARRVFCDQQLNKNNHSMSKANRFNIDSLKQRLSKLLNLSIPHYAAITASVLAVFIGVKVFYQFETQTNKEHPMVTDGLQQPTSGLTQQAELENNLIQNKPILQQESGQADLTTAVAEKSLSKGQNNNLSVVESFSGKHKSYASRLVREKSIINDEYYLPSNSNNKFSKFNPNPVKRTLDEPLSTFSIDTDTASYSYIRKQLNSGRLPLANAVRVEEMINYFDYDYPISKDENIPFSITTNVLPSPWNEKSKLIHIGIKAYEPRKELDKRVNLVFLLDVSGSMNQPDKLPLLISSLKLLLSTLSADDSIAIVTYAGHAGTVLSPTKVANKEKILAALDSLMAGGSTAGSSGIRQAYALVEQNHDPEAINRILLATDGDFNVGISDSEELKELIESKRKSGVFLSILGFGDGNYNDHIMQTLAQNGNGQAYYIDTLNEARKVLVDEVSSTFFPVAKDVKIQIEFNPDVVYEYRLIGYETRNLENEDFNNDKVDAGEIGAGHSVTALYEIVMTGSSGNLIDESRYTRNSNEKDNAHHDEYAFIKIRYKEPDSEQSKKIERPISQMDEVSDFQKSPEGVKFAVAVSAFGQLLSNSKYTGSMRYADVLNLISITENSDQYGYRREFKNLVRLADALE